MPQPALMGILNCSPDSFSGDGTEARQLQQRAEEMVAAGATWLDIGAVSSRPGAEPVSEAEEWRRLQPVLQAVRGCGARLSIDTRRGSIAARCLDQGVDLINDISGGEDPELLRVVACAQADICLMHMNGEPDHMQDDPTYPDDDAVSAVQTRLQECYEAARSAGIPDRSIVLDPGIGFGKTTQHNVAVLAALPLLRQALPTRWLLGISRKRFLPALVGSDLPAEARDHWSHLVHVQLAPWCELLRVHDVKGAAAALALQIDFQNGSHVRA